MAVVGIVQRIFRASSAAVVSKQRQTETPATGRKKHLRLCKLHMPVVAVLQTNEAPDRPSRTTR